MIIPASAGTILPDTIGTDSLSSFCLNVANNGGASANIYDDGTYAMCFKESSQNGLTFETGDSIDTDEIGESISGSSTSGSFYLNFYGSEGGVQKVILMVAVNGTIQDNFSAHFEATGYNVGYNSTSLYGDLHSLTTSDISYETGVSESFEKDDFTYGPQVTRPPETTAIYNGQDTGNTEENFSVMFVDTGLGILGNKIGDYTSIANSGLNNAGKLKVDYQVENLGESMMVVDAYGWIYSGSDDPSSPNPSISWTNIGTDGELKILNQTSASVEPVVSFTSNVTSGDAPLSVQFNDTSSGSPTSWSWDFGDGSSSTEQNATHTYSGAGTYSVNLTATNSGGISNSTVVSDYITVSISPGSLLADSAWPEFGYDSNNSGQSPYDGPQTATLKWGPVSLGIMTYLGGVAIGSDGVLYVPTQSGLFALDPDTHETKWCFSPGPQIDSIPAISSDGTIYVGAVGGYLYALSSEGSEIWNMTEAGNYITSPAIGPNGIIYSAYKSNFNAIYPDGTIKWNTTLGASVSYNSPAIGSDGTIYVGSDDKNLYAINPDDGSVKWNYSTGDKIRTSPAIGLDGTIYVGSSDGALYAINPDKTVKWIYDANNNYGADFKYCSPVIGPDGTIYIGSYGDSLLFAINPDGTEKWTLDTEKYVKSITIGNDGTIYFGSYTSASTTSSFIYAVNPDKSIKWKLPLADNWYSSPTIDSDGTLYIGSYANGNLYAIENVVDFTTTDNTFGAGSLTVQFSGFSSRTVSSSSWYWEFGDGTNYTGQNPPAHTYFSDGSYTVNLTITDQDSGEAFTASKPGYVMVYAAPEANFSADVTSGQVPMTVSFTDTSLNTPAEWLWDFGDIGIGNTSELQNPTHTYLSSGEYTVKLYVKNPAGSDTFSSTISVVAQATPVVEFEASVTEGQAPLDVTFTDLSENSPFLSWEWDLNGDGVIDSTDQNTTHTYDVYGIYNVSLTVTNYGGNSNVTKTIIVGKQDQPVAAFEANKTVGMPPLSVSFTDNSTGYNITSWHWDFGNGNTSAEQNPVYIFESEGNYSVSLNVTNDGGSNVTLSRIVVRDMLTPVANFTVNRTYGMSPLPIKFIDDSEFEPISWEWDFGDGTSSTEQNPVHTYTKNGNFTVTLKATNDAGSDTITKTDYIKSSYTNARPLPLNQSLNLYVANDEGVKYNIENGVTNEAKGYQDYVFVNNTYFMLYTESVGGVNALHVSNDPSVKYGQVTKTTNGSGEFWITHTGGQPNMHDGVLLLAVNGTIPDDFSVHIRSSGYDFEPPMASGLNDNNIGPLTYVKGAVNQTFTREDFIYGPQNWRPHRFGAYNVFQGQDMSDTSNTFELMFIDLDVGCTQTVSDGYIKVEYEFNNLTTFAVFNAYGWYNASNHGTGFVMSSTGTEYQVFGTTEPPVVGFDVSTMIGTALEPVQFNDTSSGMPYSWYWDFGDGITSTEQNPEHIYTEPGVYTVNLTATNYVGSNTTSTEIKQISGKLPEPSFTADVKSGVSPFEVNFTDTSTNSPVSWEWDFGDGTTSTEQNPAHWYAPGLYTVSLSVGNNGGNSTHTEEEYIVVTGNSSADRIVNSGFETGDNTGWELGSSAAISTAQVHSGNYSGYINYHGYVDSDCSIAQNFDLTDVSSISFWGYVTGAMDGYPQYYKIYIDDELVQTDKCSGPYTWTEYNVSIEKYVGVHEVKIGYDNGGITIDSYIDDLSTVTETSEPVSHFVAKSNTKGEYPLKVQFTDASSNYPTEWAWDFDGDGKIDSKEQSPAYTFENVGNYSVTLTTKNEKGDSSSARKNYITVKGVQKLTKDVSIKNNGTLTNSSTGSKQYTVNQSEVQVSGNNIIVDSGSYTITIKSDKTPTTNGDSLVSDVTGIELETDPVEAVLDELGNVSGSVDIELNDLPEDSGLEVTIEKGNSGSGTAFQIAASSSGLNVDNVAYTMNIVKSNLTNGKEIKEARITMSVPESWVEANGGIESIKIIRIAEDGKKEVLNTTYIGTSNGIMTFEGYSPNGLSMFGLAATTQQPEVTASLASIPASGGGTSAIGIDSAENLKAGDLATLHFDETSIYEMDVYAKTDIPVLFVTVEAGIMPEGAEAPEGDVYEYIASFLYDTPAENVSKSTIRFSILSDWVDSRLSSPDLLSLYYYSEDEDEWTKLSTVFDSEENGVCYYYADSASLGHLAIVAVPDLDQVKSLSLQSEVTEQPTLAGVEKSADSATTVATPKATPLFGSMIVFVVFGLLCTIAVVNRRCRKNDKK
ncbi:PKD domain containing protein [Methanolacinia petrolearia DSM 11571]|uniref:PKD domain containing protein n=2 Tax=Methanolacinia TaxID=230355 RepID=E1RDM3_METP4|nr:PKD domain containing protein [Methanolacinia petrolearia DSM 11571]